MIKHYIGIARPNHWFKNIFILPGIVFALLVVPTNFNIYFLTQVVFGFISACLIMSANYTINEWLDAKFDRFHPLKKNRPSVLGHIKAKYVYTQYILLATVGLSIAFFVSFLFFVTSLLLAVMGIIYNVEPFRTKDRVYLDVLSESINNPIRLLLGWFMVTSTYLPPSSLLIAYWMGGSFLMAVKRYAEIRLIKNKEIAVLYRKSFQYYTEEKLLISILFYAISFAFFFGIFLIKYKTELLLSFPFLAVMFAWYLSIGMQENSAAQRPEELYNEKKFSVYVCAVFILIIFLLFTNILWLQSFSNNILVTYPR